MQTYKLISRLCSELQNRQTKPKKQDLMLIKLNNFTLKSFVGYTNPNDLLFRAKNILFGYNGKGKSSIAIGIKDEFLKDTTKKNLIILEFLIEITFQIHYYLKILMVKLKALRQVLVKVA
jgi:hypothetical protein